MSPTGFYFGKGGKRERGLNNKWGDKGPRRTNKTTPCSNRQQMQKFGEARNVRDQLPSAKPLKEREREKGPTM